MRKAKIILSAIAIFAVVGGAFAFKASRTEDVLYFGQVGLLPTTFYTGYKTTEPGAGGPANATTTATLPVIATRTVAGA
jgi:hypothetical protein